jgi:hypothetical protein
MIPQTESPILLIKQLRENKVPGTVKVKYLLSGKDLGEYTVVFVYMSTLQLRHVEIDATASPVYIPNPLHCPAEFQVSADGRTFVKLFDEMANPIFDLVFHNSIPTEVQDVRNDHQ